MDKSLRLVRISLSISAMGKLFYKSNYRKLSSCVCIAWYKHSRRWENSRQLCKLSTSSRVCITVSNSPNPSRVYIRLCKHGKRFLLLNWHDAVCRCISKHGQTYRFETRLITSGSVREFFLQMPIDMVQPSFFFGINFQVTRLFVACCRLPSIYVQQKQCFHMTSRPPYWLVTKL